MFRPATCVLFVALLVCTHLQTNGQELRRHHVQGFTLNNLEVDPHKDASRQRRPVAKDKC